MHFAKWTSGLERLHGNRWVDAFANSSAGIANGFCLLPRRLWAFRRITAGVCFSAPARAKRPWHTTR